MSDSLSSRRQRWLALSLCGLVLLTACNRGQQERAGRVASEPGVALQQLVRHVIDDDLVGYARAAVPPDRYTRLATAWSQGHSRWPLVQLPLSDRLLPVLQTFAQPGSEKTLMASFDRQLGGQAGSVRQAAQTLGQFGVQYVRSEHAYSPAQREHYVQLLGALSQWAAQAPLTDRKRAQSSVTLLAAAARQAGLDSDQALQDAGMEGSLRRLGPVGHTVKSALAAYGLPVDTILEGMEIETSEQKGDHALLLVRYTVSGQQVAMQVRMQRMDGHWYPSGTLEAVDSLLQEAERAEAQRAEAMRAEAMPPPAEAIDDGGQDASTPAKP